MPFTNPKTHSMGGQASSKKLSKQARARRARNAAMVRYHGENWAKKAQPKRKPAARVPQPKRKIAAGSRNRRGRK